jgi:hypothetical protein
MNGVILHVHSCNVLGKSVVTFSRKYKDDVNNELSSETENFKYFATHAVTISVTPFQFPS